MVGRVGMGRVVWGDKIAYVQETFCPFENGIIRGKTKEYVD